MSIGSTELSKQTGASIRQIQSWTHMGIIPEQNSDCRRRVGSGQQFQYDEKIVPMVRFLANVAKEFYMLGNINTGVLGLISSHWNTGELRLSCGLTLSWKDY